MAEDLGDRSDEGCSSWLLSVGGLRTATAFFFFQQFHTDAENRIPVRPVLWKIPRTKSFLKTLPCLNTGWQGDRFCRHFMGKIHHLEWFLKPLEIFGKCEQPVPYPLSLINCFFKKWLCFEERAVYFFLPPLAPFPELWFLNTKR